MSHLCLIMAVDLRREEGCKLISKNNTLNTDISNQWRDIQALKRRKQDHLVRLFMVKAEPSIDENTVPASTVRRKGGSKNPTMLFS